MNMKRNVSTRGQSIIMENSGRQPMTAAKCALAKGKTKKTNIGNIKFKSK